ncbi:uncharacterized protein LOC126968954 [Leptidea sinapis]|uniref:uncharacterized protein LOC126968954 n=1 Tax=Leptidea sinapis TaxID=189913 RepID=UPI00214015BB|nr:uncharacterized protein LOC126968954 [Leptidea sinapis]
MEAVKEKCANVERILSSQLKGIARDAGFDNWEVERCDVRPAAQGLSGFLGDHFKLDLHLRKDNTIRIIHLFAKFLPLINIPKAKLVMESNFFQREALMYDLFDKLGVYNDQNPWCPKALRFNETLVVMPDLSYEGYRNVAKLECLDLQHVRAVVTSMAKFHAAFACYEANRNCDLQHPHSFYDEHREELMDKSFMDSPWLRAAAKLTYNFLKEFSTKQLDRSVEKIMIELFIDTCNDLRQREDSLNVLIHRDLWTNNIMFRYDGTHPTDAVMLDFQCVRYGPPAFDIMIFLYLTTSRKFRLAHEMEVLNHYYTVFTHCLDDVTKGKLKDYNYGRWDLFNWCEKARRFAMMETLAIHPFVLMEEHVAEETFDNPDTFVKYNDEDRSGPVLKHARENETYRSRQLEHAEEFVDRYVYKLI